MKDYFYPIAKLGRHAIKSSLKKSILGEFSKEEKVLRIQLAASYQLFHKFGWDDTIYGHLTCRIPGTRNFLINPFGLLYDEITASSLIKIDFDGKIVHPGSTELGINPAGYQIHGLIHQSTHHHVVFHCHQVDATAVSTFRFDPICQTAHTFGDVSYSKYYGINVDAEKTQDIVKDLKGNNILVLSNHGILTCGSNIPETFYSMYQFIESCKIQVRASGFKYTIPDEKIIQESRRIVREIHSEGLGQKEFCAFMRRLEKEKNIFKH